jgi:hypothetical protein
LATKSAGSAAVVDAGVGVVAITLATSATQVLESAALVVGGAVVAGAVVVAGVVVAATAVGVVAGADESELELHAAATVRVMTSAAIGMAPRRHE